MAEILDLDALCPDKSPVKFTDRSGKPHEFDAAFVSFRVGLMLIANMGRFQKLASAATSPGSITEEDFTAVIDVISAIAVQEDKTLTADFLMDNLGVSQAMHLLSVAMGFITEYLGRNQPGAAAGDQESPSE